MSLEEKAKRLVEARKPEALDWGTAARIWLTSLSELRDQITRWLGPLQAKNLVTLKRTGVQISEHGETYTAPGLVLEFGDEGIVLDPIGAIVVGALGRVDVYPRGGRPHAVMFILSGPVESPVWEIWRSHDPRDREPLTQQSFESLLESLLDV